MSIIGLDIGTTGCKALVFDREGRIIGRASREYPILTPQPGWAEQDAELVWHSAWDALREAVAAARGDSPVALALSAQGEAVTPVDSDGRAISPTILGMDTRTIAENQWLTERFGAEALFRRTGMTMHTVNTFPKLLWLQRHMPDIWRHAQQFLLYEDFFLRRLGGTASISHCLASRTQMYDLIRRDWADDLLAACGVERERLARLAPDNGGVVGSLRPNLACELGGTREMLLGSGGHDHACAALGAGVCQPGLAMVSTGTAEVVEVAMSAPSLDERLRQGHISIYRHVVPELFVAMTLNHSGGLALRWLRDALYCVERDRALAAGRDPYDDLLADAPAGPTSLMMLPHLSGSGTPILDTTSKGAFIGLTYNTTRAEMAKAILEGLTFELRANLDLLREGGVAIKSLHAVGGGARSPLWLRLKADICNTPLRAPRVTEAACLGAALLAGVAAGVYTNLNAAVAQTVSFQQWIEPDCESVAAYERRYRLYQQLYPALIALQRQL